MRRLGYERDMKSAIESVKAGQLSANEAARTYSVSSSTLSRRFAGGLSAKEARIGTYRLSATEELAVIKTVEAMDANGVPITCTTVRNAADSIVLAKGAPPVGITGAYRFIKRTEQLRIRYTQALNYRRALSENRDTLSGWFKQYSDLKAKYDVLDSDTYNMDETDFHTGTIRSSAVVVGSPRKKKRKVTQSGNREWATVIACIAGDGTEVPGFVVVKSKSLDHDWFDHLRSHWALECTPKGWSDEAVGIHWVKHFDLNTKERAGNRCRLLLLDGHAIHKSVLFREYCEEHKIILAYLPVQSSHLTQPLDVGIFSSFKKYYSDEVTEFVHNEIKGILPEELFFVGLSRSYERAFTHQNRLDAFRGAGLIPWNPDVVLSKLTLCPEEANASPLPGVSQ